MGKTKWDAVIACPGKVYSPIGLGVNSLSVFVMVAGPDISAIGDHLSSLRIEQVIEP